MATPIGTEAVLKVYPAFDRGKHRPGNPPAHALFGPSAVDVWGEEMLDFLRRTAKSRTSGERP